MWDGGKNGQKGGLPTWRVLKNARRSPAGVFLPSEMLAGVPLTFFWPSEMLATDARAFFGTQKCWRLMRGHFFALRNAGD